jgi:hypothetical protein
MLDPSFQIGNAQRGHASLWYRLYELTSIGGTGLLRSHLVDFSTDGHADKNLNRVPLLAAFMDLALVLGPGLHTKTQIAPMKNHPTFHR